MGKKTGCNFLVKTFSLKMKILNFESMTAKPT